MLPKQYRITAQEFYNNPSSFRRYTSSIAEIRCKPSKDLQSRFCVVVRKATEKKATSRHRSKRLMIEILRNILPDLNGGFDISITLKQPIVKEKREEAERQLQEILKKMNLLKV